MEQKYKPHFTGKIGRNIHLKGDYYILEVVLPENDEINPLEKPLPGQFYLLKPHSSVKGGYSGSLLNKPLSVYDYRENILSFMIKKVGRGTAELTSMQEQELIVLSGPLGKSFQLPGGNKPESVLLVSGGIGYAPLNYLKNSLCAANHRVKWLHGGRQSCDVFEADTICTDDGSEGSMGFITQCIPDILACNKEEKISRIYCCGPQAMMKVVWDYAGKYNIPAQFCLEEYMACGIGVCLGCAVKKKTTDGKTEYLMVCKDGPVFRGEEIDWNE